MLTTLPPPPLRPGRETEAELAARLWAAQRALGEAMADLEVYCDRGGDLHGGGDTVDALSVYAERTMRRLRDLALRLDRTVAERD
jgi:hypothetical protein